MTALDKKPSVNSVHIHVHVYLLSLASRGFSTQRHAFLLRTCKSFSLCYHFSPTLQIRGLSLDPRVLSSLSSYAHLTELSWHVDYMIYNNNNLIYESDMVFALVTVSF